MKGEMIRRKENFIEASYKVEKFTSKTSASGEKVCSLYIGVRISNLNSYYSGVEKNY